MEKSATEKLLKLKNKGERDKKKVTKLITSEFQYFFKNRKLVSCFYYFTLGRGFESRNNECRKDRT